MKFLFLLPVCVAWAPLPRAGIARRRVVAHSDDGWGADDDSDVVQRAAEERRRMALEEAKKSLQNSVPPSPREEPDKFVPIMVVVSSAGFFGAYAYETFRLYQAGELWLPFIGNVQ